MPSPAWATTKARCSTTTRPSPSTPRTPWRSSIGPTRIRAAAITTRRWPITPKRFASTPVTRAYNARGILYVECDDRDAALADFTAAIERDPGFARAYHNRGNLRADREELPEAVADHTEAIRLDPGFAPAYFNRANVLAQRDDLEAALADFNEALRLQAGHAGALNNRGNAHWRRGDGDAALADFTAAIAADPTFALPYYNRANVLGERGEHRAALADYTEALRLAPDDLSALHNRGKVYTLLGEIDKALADNLEALQLAPDDARTNNNLAWLWATAPRADLRNPARAVECALKACASADSEEPNALDTLAAAYAANGQFVEAVETQRQAVELAPEAEKDDYRSRLALYEAERPFVQEQRSFPATEDAKSDK